MVNGRQEEAWGRLSAILATLVNVHPHKGGRAYKPDDFNPYRKDEKELNANTLRELRKELGDA